MTVISAMSKERAKESIRDSSLIMVSGEMLGETPLARRVSQLGLLSCFLKKTRLGCGLPDDLFLNDMDYLAVSSNSWCDFIKQVVSGGEAAKTPASRCEHS